MAHADFVHLHLHTEYSLLDGACRLDRLMERARELQFPALAITDHGVLHGAIEFYQTAQKNGIKPILGCEAYVAPGSRHEKKSSSGGRDVYHHLLLLAKDQQGYKNLVRLATLAHTEGYYYKPRIDKELLAECRQGLVVLSGCLASEIPSLIVEDRLEDARAAVDWFKQTFGPENFYLEVQNHGIAEQVKVNRQLVPWAKEFGLKLVATNDVHYLRKEHSRAHDCLICIGTQAQLADAKRMRYAEEQFYLRSAEEMKARFAELPEAVSNTLEVAEKCNLELKADGRTLHYPVFHPPEHFTREGYLRQLLAEGLQRRYTLRVRVEGNRFVVEGIDDPTLLPTYQHAAPPSVGADQTSARVTPSAIQATSGPLPKSANFQRDAGSTLQRASDVPSEDQTSRGAANAQAASGTMPASVNFQRDAGSTLQRASDVPSEDQTSRGAANAQAASASEDRQDARPTLADPAVSAAIQVVLDRLQQELAVIEKTGFVSYFLIVADFVAHGRTKGIACVARGSAAGSLVTYLLDIANVDPIRYGLLFERFLNPERISPPDIDIDFADDRRADVIEYVREKYGRDCVAQIITFGTMGAKSVVRDVGRVMGLNYGDCDRLAKMIPADLKMTLEKALQQSPEFKQAYDSEEVTRELVDLALVLEDLSRNASVHAAGVVIGPEPLIHLLPLKQDDSGGLVTQYAMGPVGDLGLLKMDFLGLKTLTVIRNVCEMVRQTRGVEVNIDRIPLDDAKTYDLLNKGNTVGVFQLESGGMRDLCRKFQISSVEHITALVALYRPGPMDLIPDFIKRRHGEVAIEYPHPLLEPIARETYGVLVYQEQVMQAAQVLAGYTLGGADVLRRAMGKKKKEEMDQQRAVFVKGCREKNQLPERKANEVFDLLDKFAGYGFNKSHAAAYALVAYQTAYLKANYPVEFLAAMMTNDMGSTDKLAIVLGEAAAMNVEVLPPDVNEGQAFFGPARGRNGPGSAIRFGLAAIKGVGEVAVQTIIHARTEGGLFTTLEDLCTRVDTRTVNRRVLEALIKCGACDCLGETRAAMFARVERALARGSSIAADRARGQASLFGMLEETPTTPAAAKTNEGLPEWPQHELLAAEKELLGFYVTGHPLTPYAPILEKYLLHDSLSAKELPGRTMTRTGGMISAVQQAVSKKSGKPYALATLEDLRGAMSLLCLNENYDRFRDLLTAGRAVVVIGEVNNDEDKPKIFPQEMYPLEEAPRRFTQQVHLRLFTAHLTPERLEAVRTLAEAHRGKCPLYLCLRRPTGENVFIETHDRFAVTPSLELQRAADELFGEETYFVRVDTSLPERKQRWTRRNGGDTGDE